MHGRKLTLETPASTVAGNAGILVMRLQRDAVLEALILLECMMQIFYCDMIFCYELTA